MCYIITAPSIPVTFTHRGTTITGQLIQMGYGKKFSHVQVRHTNGAVSAYPFTNSTLPTIMTMG